MSQNLLKASEKRFFSESQIHNDKENRREDEGEKIISMVDGNHMET